MGEEDEQGEEEGWEQKEGEEGEEEELAPLTAEQEAELSAAWAELQEKVDQVGAADEADGGKALDETYRRFLEACPELQPEVFAAQLEAEYNDPERVSAALHETEQDSVQEAVEEMGERFGLSEEDMARAARQMHAENAALPSLDDFLEGRDSHVWEWLHEAAETDDPFEYMMYRVKEESWLNSDWSTWWKRQMPRKPAGWKPRSKRPFTQTLSMRRRRGATAVAERDEEDEEE
ncbi:hypothetical protein V8C86DRAFT_2990429 [Haematococcus lacustris]